MKTMTFVELKKLSFTNSKDMPQKVVIEGIIHEWVGIGWAELDEATEEEKKELFTII